MKYNFDSIEKLQKACLRAEVIGMEHKELSHKILKEGYEKHCEKTNSDIMDVMSLVKRCLNNEHIDIHCAHKGYSGEKFRLICEHCNDFIVEKNYKSVLTLYNDIMGIESNKTTYTVEIAVRLSNKAFVTKMIADKLSISIRLKELIVLMLQLIKNIISNKDISDDIDMSLLNAKNDAIYEQSQIYMGYSKIATGMLIGIEWSDTSNIDYDDIGIKTLKINGSNNTYSDLITMRGSAIFETNEDDITKICLSRISREIKNVIDIEHINLAQRAIEGSING